MRRRLLSGLVLFTFLSGAISTYFADSEIEVEKDRVIAFLRSVENPSGGFTWGHGWSEPNILNTYAAVAVLQELEGSFDTNATVRWLLSQQIEDGTFGSPLWYTNIDETYWAVTTLLDMGVDIPNATGLVSSLLAMQERSPSYPFWTHVSGNQFECTFYGISLLIRLNASIPLSDEIAETALSRQFDDGGFSDLNDKASSVQNTYWAISTLTYLGYGIPNKEKVVNFILPLQHIDGGFGYGPNDDSNLLATYYAISSLHILGAQPRDVHKCVNWILSIQNLDGGFADPQGWSSPIDTWTAVATLRMLNVSFYSESARVISDSTSFINAISELLEDNAVFRSLLEEASRARSIGDYSEAVRLARLASSQAISTILRSVENTIYDSLEAGADVKSAYASLLEARSAYETGEYYQAVALALKAKSEAEASLKASQIIRNFLWSQTVILGSIFALATIMEKAGRFRMSAMLSTSYVCIWLTSIGLQLTMFFPTRQVDLFISNSLVHLMLMLFMLWFTKNHSPLLNLVRKILGLFKGWKKGIVG